MTIYIVTREAFPYGMAAVKRIICMSKAIIESGYKCKVLIFRPNSYDSTFPAEGVWEGIPYLFVGGSSLRKSSYVRAKIQAMAHSYSLLVYLKNNLKAGDVVYGYLSTANRFRKRIIDIVHNRESYYVSELCEFPYGTGEETKKIQKEREYELQKLFPQYDGVIAISEALKDLAYQYCSPQCCIVKIPILVEYEKYNLPDTSNTSNIPYIFHSGTLYEQKDGILGMIKAFGKAQAQMKTPIRFLLTGKLESSPHKQEIENLIEKYKISDSIMFTGYLSNEELRNKLSAASLVIINKYPNQQNTYCFSTKLGEYMAAGKAIIITRVGEAINWLEDGVDSCVVTPGDNDQLAESIVKLLSSKDIRRRLGIAAQEKCYNAFDYHSQTKIINELICGLKK